MKIAAFRDGGQARYIETLIRPKRRRQGGFLIYGRTFAATAREALREWRWIARAAFDPSLRANPDIEWLFILAMPNTGSTALAKLLASAGRAATLAPNGEGQWLVPSMVRPIKRWDPAYHPNYAVVRAVWLHELARRGRKRLVAIEKSPPNLCRYEALLKAFGVMKTSVVTYSRDPYATCASWHMRYGRDGVAADWGFDRTPTSELDYFEALGRLWARRATMLDRARRSYGCHIRYEDFCADPSAAIRKIAALVPALADANPAARVAVKDYEVQPIRDMNANQIARLSAAQIAAISAGLQEAAPTVENLGYKVQT